MLLAMPGFYTEQEQASFCISCTKQKIQKPQV